MAIANATSPAIGRVGLSGSGFLIHFLIGALAGLEERGAIVRSVPGGASVPIDQQTVFAGSSGGAILSVVSCLGVPYSAVERESNRLADYCAAHNDCALTLDAQLRRTLSSALAAMQPTLGPGGVAKAVERCRGKAFVNLSVFAPEKKAELYENREGYSVQARRADRRRRGGRGHTNSNATAATTTSAGRHHRATRDDNEDHDGSSALAEIGLQFRPGNVLCSAMDVSVKAQAALLGLTQAALPPGLGLHPRPWLVSDWRSAEDAIVAAAASSFNALLSALSPTTSFRGVPLVADGVYTVPLPVPPPEAAPNGGGSGGGLVRISSVPDGYAMAPGSAKIFGADIWPGARTGHDLAGYGTVEAWLCHALVVPDAGARRRMVELGRREAALFLDEREREERERAGAASGG